MFEGGIKNFSTKMSPFGRAFSIGVAHRVVTIVCLLSGSWLPLFLVRAGTVSCAR